MLSSLDSTPRCASPTGGSWRDLLSPTAGGGPTAGGSGGTAGTSPQEQAAEAGGARPPVISFSHFLPRQELLPEKRML